MRNLFFTLILSFVFCGVMVAQETSLCPKISIIGSIHTPTHDKPITFAASISKEVDGFKPEYKWKVEEGEIIKGQGTLNIEVTPKDYFWSITAMLKVEGLPEGCPNIASARYTPEREEIGNYIILPELHLPAPRIDKQRLKSLALRLQTSTEYNGFIFHKFKKGTSQLAIRQTLSNSLNYLERKLKIDRKRITFGINKADEDSLRLTTFQVGNSMFPCDECIVLDVNNSKKALDKLFPVSQKKVSRKNAKRYQTHR